MKNKFKKLSQETQDFLKVISSLASKMNVSIYLVGGVVRDMMIGKGHFDLDILVEGDAIAFAKKVSDHYDLSCKKHHAFGTATVYFENYKIDFATARKETYSKSGALPKVKASTLQDDLARRDFTINAMAVSLNKNDYGKIIDLYGGQKDLKASLIRVLHDQSFMDDPTRIFRAIRFEQRLSFSLEKNTLKLLKAAVKNNALALVNPHRIREELILLLSENIPDRVIKRVSSLLGLNFIAKGLILKPAALTLITEISKVLKFYDRKFKKNRVLKTWILHLAALIIDLPLKSVEGFLEDFGFKKGERIIILSIKENYLKIKKLNAKTKPHVIYQTFDPLSFETIVFFYASFPKGSVRKQIEDFLDDLVHVRVLIKGNDLKCLGITPFSIYNELLEKLLLAKMDNNLKTKEDELEEVERIYASIIPDIYKQ
ncbi:MAG: hypothetical protein PHV17_03160 [Candidatus Omnitrophica bacterium]|nr:hypothetical protein [Candidatus Omnitrophota bacterium]